MGADTSKQCAQEWGCRAHDEEGNELTCGDRCTKFWSVAHIAAFVIIAALVAASVFGVEYVMRLTDKDGITIRPVIRVGGNTNQLAGANHGQCSSCVDADVPVGSGQTELVSTFLDLLSHISEEDPDFVQTVIHGVLRSHSEAHSESAPFAILQTLNYTAHPVTRHCSHIEPCVYKTENAPAIAYLNCENEIGLQNNCQHATSLGVAAPAP